MGYAGHLLLPDTIASLRVVYEYLTEGVHKYRPWAFPCNRARESGFTNKCRPIHHQNTIYGEIVKLLHLKTRPDRQYLFLVQYGNLATFGFYFWVTH